MSTPTLERPDLEALGIEEPVMPCNMSEADVATEEGTFSTPPHCPRPAVYLVIFHNYCWTCTSCKPCYELYLTLVGKMNPDTMTCGTCKKREPKNGGNPIIRVVPLNAP